MPFRIYILSLTLIFLVPYMNSFLSLGGAVVAASTIVVDVQNAGKQDGTAAHPYRTLPQALAAAAPGDTITIRTGVYTFQGGALVFNKAGSIRAENGPVTIVWHNAQPAPSPGPNIASFTAAPNNGYIYVGTSATLTWSIDNCDVPNTCTVELFGQDGPNFQNLAPDPNSPSGVASWVNLPAKGLKAVAPTRSTETRYTLQARSLSSTDTKKKVITLYRPPPSDPGMYYYFKMTNPQSSVTPCFTLAIYAPNETTGKQLAEAQNGGYAATKITYQEFVGGC
jgi:hypothetical protein